MKEDTDYFRANIGAMIVNDAGQLLAFRRIHIDTEAWQLPQGGLLRGEAPIAGALREVREETAITPDKLSLVTEAAEWLAYELPEAYRKPKTGRGQVQKWFLFRFLGSDADIQPDQQEFSVWKWMDPASLLQAAVAFRRPVYRRVLAEFHSHFPAS